MISPTIIGLVNNIALLLALGLIYDMVGYRSRGAKPSFQQVIAGIVLGAIGVAVMLTPWELTPGIFFDTRSVLLSVSGLFFGTAPTLIAVIMTAVLRFSIGGSGAWMGVAVIFTSGGIGVAWRHLRKEHLGVISIKELYVFGLVVHLNMLFWMLTLPWPLPLKVLSQVGVPVMVIHPIGTALLGWLMISRQRRKRTEMQLQESEGRYRALFERSSDAIFLLDTGTGRYLDANLAAERLSGRPLNEIQRLSTTDITPQNASERLQAVATSKRKGVDMGEVVYLRPDGSERTALVSTVSIQDGLAFGLARDITERKQAELVIQNANKELHSQLAEIKELEVALREQALRDPLTGLFNRRYMEEALKQEFAKATRKETCLSVVMLDLDNLKEINDLYGHGDGGDKALQVLANSIQPLCRTGDTFCRYAGDEFMIMLYDTSLNAAYKRTLEWRDVVAKVNIICETGEFGITFSAGISEYPSHGITGNELFQQADRALYQAKGLGRNRVVMYEVPNQE